MAALVQHDRLKTGGAPDAARPLLGTRQDQMLGSFPREYEPIGWFRHPQIKQDVTQDAPGHGAPSDSPARELRRHVHLELRNPTRARRG